MLVEQALAPKFRSLQSHNSLAVEGEHRRIPEICCSPAQVTAEVSKVTWDSHCPPLPSMHAQVCKHPHTCSHIRMHTWKCHDETQRFCTLAEKII